MLLSDRALLGHCLEILATFARSLLSSGFLGFKERLHHLKELPFNHQLILLFKRCLHMCVYDFVIFFFFLINLNI